MTGAVDTLFIPFASGDIDLPGKENRFAFLNAAGPQTAAFVETLGALPVTSPAARVALHAMRERQHAPLFPTALAHKDLDYALAAAADLGVTLPLVTAARARFAEALARGHGESNLTAVGLLDA